MTKKNSDFVEFKTKYPRRFFDPRATAKNKAVFFIWLGGLGSGIVLAIISGAVKIFELPSWAGLALIGGSLALLPFIKYYGTGGHDVHEVTDKFKSLRDKLIRRKPKSQNKPSPIPLQEEKPKKPKIIEETKPSKSQETEKPAKTTPQKPESKYKPKFE